MQIIDINDRLPLCTEQHNKIYSSGKVLVYGNEGWEIDEYLYYCETNQYRWNNVEGVTHWTELPPRPKK